MVDAAVTRDVMQSGSNLGTCRKEADLTKNHMPSRQAIVIGMTRISQTVVSVGDNTVIRTSC